MISGAFRELLEKDVSNILTSTIRSYKS